MCLIVLPISSIQRIQALQEPNPEQGEQLQIPVGRPSQPSEHPQKEASYPEEDTRLFEHARNADLHRPHRPVGQSAYCLGGNKRPVDALKSVEDRYNLCAKFSKTTPTEPTHTHSSYKIHHARTQHSASSRLHTRIHSPNEGRDEAEALERAQAEGRALRIRADDARDAESERGGEEAVRRHRDDVPEAERAPGDEQEELEELRTCVSVRGILRA